MTAPVARPPTDLARRLERFRAAVRSPDAGAPTEPLPHAPLGGEALAVRLAETLDGEVVRTPLGRYVRVEGRTIDLPIDRDRLATLPGQPPPDRPLVCLDTETTGLATATGTVAFLIGLGWWQGDRFHQVQLVLPDHADERALLDELAGRIPADAWLVTYNGRGFDWPLLVTRYRMAGRGAPVHDGHLDLLPIVRRLFRHRMDDARLQTAERTLLGLARHDDVDGWEIPGRYLGFLRGGPAHPLRAVVRHNDEDVRSLARLIGLLDEGYGTPEARQAAPVGDLAGLARAFARVRRHEDALRCLDEVLERSDLDRRPTTAEPAASATPPVVGAPARSLPWWSPQARPDFGGRPRPGARGPSPWHRTAAFAQPWDAQRVAADRAHLLRRLGRHAEAVDAWAEVAAGPGRTAVVACIEVAKLREHRLGDPAGALEAARRGWAAAERRRQLGMPEPALEADLRHRLARLARRRASAARAAADGRLGTMRGPASKVPDPDGPKVAGPRARRDDESAVTIPHGPGMDRREGRDAGDAVSLDRR